MNCECVYDGPYPEFIDETKRKCRKPKKCCECKQTIQKGQTYIHVAGKWEGEFLSFNTCDLCWDLRKRCDFACVAFGYIGEEISERWGETDIEIEAFKKRRGWV